MAIDYLGVAGVTGLTGILLSLVSAAQDIPRDKSRAFAAELQPVSFQLNVAPCPPMAEPSIRHTHLDPINLLPDVHQASA
jgi:hypothetical protein